MGTSNQASVPARLQAGSASIELPPGTLRHKVFASRPGPEWRAASRLLYPAEALGSRAALVEDLALVAHAEIELLDVAGRLVASKELGSLAAGRHVIALELSGEVTPGLYLVRLSQGAESRIRRVAILK